MTNYKSNEKPDLDIILQDKENYPVLFEKYQQVLEGKYMSQIGLNKLENSGEIRMILLPLLVILEKDLLKEVIQ